MISPKRRCGLDLASPIDELAVAYRSHLGLEEK